MSLKEYLLTVVKNQNEKIKNRILNMFDPKYAYKKQLFSNALRLHYILIGNIISFAALNVEYVNSKLV